MTGWFRLLYKIVGWEYPEKADEKQIRLRHLLLEQIRKTKNIKSILNKNKGTNTQIKKSSKKKIIIKKKKHLKKIIK